MYGRQDRRSMQQMQSYNSMLSFFGCLGDNPTYYFSILISFRLITTDLYRIYTSAMCLQSTISSRPSQHIFSQDVEKCPRTDVRGDQELHAAAIRRCAKYHDSLPVNNSSSIPGDLGGLTLPAKLYDSAMDLGHSVPRDEMTSVYGPQAIVEATHKRNRHSVFILLYTDTLLLLST